MTKRAKRTRVRKQSQRVIPAASPDEPRDYQSTDITPEAFFLAWSRRRKEALIDVLIESLNAADCDPDLEDGGDAEPSLGFREGEAFVGTGYQHGGPSDDREADSADDEPSLGSIEDHPNPYRDGTDHPGCGRDQRHWAGGSTDDREGDEHDGREPDGDEGGEAEREDYEPSLGWTAREAAFGRYAEFNGCVDLEEQCEDEGDQSDSGIGDQDGLMEQCAGHRAVNGSWAGRTRYEPYVS